MKSHVADCCKCLASIIWRQIEFSALLATTSSCIAYELSLIVKLVIYFLVHLPPHLILYYYKCFDFYSLILATALIQTLCTSYLRLYGSVFNANRISHYTSNSALVKALKTLDLVSCHSSHRPGHRMPIPTSSTRGRGRRTEGGEGGGGGGGEWETECTTTSSEISLPYIQKKHELEQVFKFLVPPCY